MYVHATRSRAREHRALDGPSAQRCVRVNGAAKHVPHPRMLRARASRLAGCPRSAGHASGCALLLSVTQCTSWQHHLPHNRFVQCAASVCSAQSAVRAWHACSLPRFSVQISMVCPQRRWPCAERTACFIVTEARAGEPSTSAQGGEMREGEHVQPCLKTLKQIAGGTAYKRQHGWAPHQRPGLSVRVGFTTAQVRF